VIHFVFILGNSFINLIVLVIVSKPEASGGQDEIKSMQRSALVIQQRYYRKSIFGREKQRCTVARLSQKSHLLRSAAGRNPGDTLKINIDRSFSLKRGQEAGVLQCVTNLVRLGAQVQGN
jgi:hypothetical protein